MTAGNDVFKAFVADTSPFIVKGWLVPVYTDNSLKEMSMEQKVDEILRLLKIQKIEVALDINSLQTAENEKLKLH